jgi:hypothetical protein
MAREEQPTLTDESIGSEIHLQTLWAEIGTDAQYYVHGVQGDCLVIHLKLTQDLKFGQPYHPTLMVDVAFVLDARENPTSNRLVRRSSKPPINRSKDDTLLDLSSDDQPRRKPDRQTIPEMPAVRIRSTINPTAFLGEADRHELWFKSLTAIAGRPLLRTLFVSPTMDLTQQDERPWFLEIKMSPYGLVRRIRPAHAPLFR